jgi:hypothetical protein
VTFDGDAGPMAVDGKRFGSTLALRSTLFTVAVEGAGGPAAPAVDGQVTEEAAPSPEAPPVAAAGVPAPAAGSLGRAPWIALALLLMAAWGLAARRVTEKGPSP